MRATRAGESAPDRAGPGTGLGAGGNADPAGGPTAGKHQEQEHISSSVTFTSRAFHLENSKNRHHYAHVTQYQPAARVDGGAAGCLTK